MQLAASCTASGSLLASDLNAVSASNGSLTNSAFFPAPVSQIAELVCFLLAFGLRTASDFEYGDAVLLSNLLGLAFFAVADAVSLSNLLGLAFFAFELLVFRDEKAIRGNTLIV